MILFWKVRYLDSADREFKDRDLYLDTRTLDPVKRAAIELVVECKSSKTERDILKYRHLFHEDNPESPAGTLQGWGSFETFALDDYFEDETGKEITLQELGPLLTGSLKTVVVPRGAKQHDLDLMLAEKKPIPIAEVSLTPEEIRLLGYFSRELQELSEAAFMKDGSLTIKGVGGEPILETAVTDDEIRSFVMIFRCLYMTGEQTNFFKATGVFTKAVGDHPYGAWVAGVASEYQTRLDSTPDFRPSIPAGTHTFTAKRLIDVFLYTQYAHPPSKQRQRQFNECLSQLQGKRSLLTGMFLLELIKCSALIIRAGRRIAHWFSLYCDHHGVTPDILNSLRLDHPGLGAAEKEEARRERLFQEKAEELAMELWKQHDRPEGGPTQFLLMAREQLGSALEDQETG
jgi:hypothetical protein